MNPKTSPDPMSSMWAWIAHDVRFYRTRAKMSGEAFGEMLGAVRSTVSRIESGALKIDEKQAALLDRHFATGGHFVRLLTYAQLGHDPDWFKTFTGYEKQATSIRIYEALVVTGLLQTEEYARELLTRARVVEDIGAALEARRERQTLWEREKPPDVWVLLNWPVLHQPVGGPKIMREQLAHLLEMSERPNVSLRVVPREAGAHVGLDGPFSTLESPTTTAGYAAALPKGRLILATTEVAWYKDKFELVGSDALTRSASRDMLYDVMKEYE